MTDNVYPRYIMALGRVFRSFFCYMTRRIMIPEATEMDRGLHESRFFLLRGRDNAQFFVNPQSPSLRLP